MSFKQTSNGIHYGGGCLMTSWSYNQLWNLCTFGIALMDSYCIKIVPGAIIIYPVCLLWLIPYLSMGAHWLQSAPLSAVRMTIKINSNKICFMIIKFFPISPDFRHQVWDSHWGYKQKKVIRFTTMFFRISLVPILWVARPWERESQI